MNRGRIVSSLVLLLVALSWVDAQPFNFPPPLTQNFALGTENYIVQWAGASLQGARHDSIGDAGSARRFALMATTMSDVVNAFILPQQYRFYGNINYTAPEGANLLAAIAGAGYQMMTSIHSAQALDWQVIYKTQIDLLRRGPFAPTPIAVTLGFNFGRDVANDRLTDFANDGSNGPSLWVPPNPNVDGSWRPAPPNFGSPTDAQYANATTWVLPSSEFFRPAGPAWSNPQIFINNFREIYAKGVDGSTGRSRRSVLETYTATFFELDSHGLTTSPGLFYDIATEIARDNDLPLLETSRLLSLTALALVDASYAAYDAKYHYNDWRPITGITQISSNNALNLGLTQDPNWVPLLQTPSTPDYVSVASTVGAAAGTVWRRFIGTDSFTFFATSDALPGVTVQYESFQQLIDDNGYAKVFGGVNWRKSCEDGVFLGGLVGDFVFNNALAPLA